MNAIHAQPRRSTTTYPRAVRLRQLLLVAALATLALAAALLAPPARADYTLPQLVGIRAAAHPTYDRVVFDFRYGSPSSVSVGWVSRLLGDGSGLPVPIAGRAILQVTMSGVDAHDENGEPTAPDRTAYPLKNVITTVRAGDYEGYVTYGIGLAAKTSYTTMRLTSPDRFVVDVSTSSLTTVRRNVYFVDHAKIDAKLDPPVTAVQRPVLTAAPATGVMDRLYAGPTPAEYAIGLRLVASRSTGFSNLSIASTVARVRLVGGCSSGGSAVATVATEIFPSLRQFSTVDWVKIYDPKGRTEHPSGLSDSIPTCLEP